MKKIMSINFLRCPYCQEKIAYENVSDGFGTAVCMCEIYPIINHVIFLQKNDILLQKNLTTLVKQKKHFKAVWTALSQQKTTHRIIVFLNYYFSKKLGIRFSQKTILQLLQIVGPARSWFKYLLESHRRNTLKTAVHVINSMGESNKKILDVGCGIGTFINNFEKNNERQKISYVGIDKSFMSLLLASEYNLCKEKLFVCCDTESGLPFARNCFTQVLVLDTFAWIYNKKMLLSESARVLSEKGVIAMINVHRESKRTRSWGYGIEPINLKKWLQEKYKKIKFLDNDLSKNEKLIELKIDDVKTDGYSFVAEKKSRN